MDFPKIFCNIKMYKFLIRMAGVEAQAIELDETQVLEQNEVFILERF